MPNLPKKKQLEIFDQNQALTPLKNANFATFLNRSFYGQKKASFLYKTSPDTFSRINVPKKKGKSNFKHFDENLFKTVLQWLRRVVFYLEKMPNNVYRPYLPKKK